MYPCQDLSLVACILALVRLLGSERSLPDLKYVPLPMHIVVLFEFWIFWSEVVSFYFWGTLWVHPWRTFWVHPWSNCWFHPWKFTRFFWWDEMRTCVSLVSLGLKLFCWDVFYLLYFRLCLDFICWYFINVSFLKNILKVWYLCNKLACNLTKWWCWYLVFKCMHHLV